MKHAIGPLLRIDVENRTATEESIDDVLREFIGGRGVGTKLAHDNIPFDAEPFGPENRVYLTTGPLQMSQMSFTGRMSMTTLSPLTNGICSSNAGGFLSRNFTGTGYSAVEIVGSSDELVAVHVTDDGVEFEDVSSLKGATVPEVSEHMADEHDLEPDNLVSIGPAGENLVRFASAMTFDSRAFGRGGHGAVLGSKNVKCLSFRGDSTPSVELDGDVEMSVHRDAATSDDMKRRQGTTAGTVFINENYSVPTRYFSEMGFENIDGISGDRVEEKKYKKGSCSVCAFACKLPTRDEETGLETEGPEFETVFSFGANCGVDDIVAVMKSNELCDTLGMDTISAGNAVAAYLASEDEFGNADLVHELTEKIAHREGIGDTLAEGVARAHDDLGVEDWSVKGLDFAAHDGRTLWGQGLSYAVSNRGADHLYTSTLVLEYGDLENETLEGKPELVIERENHRAFEDSAIICRFSGRHVDESVYEGLLDADYDDLLSVGNRIVELERHFHNQRGVTREDDTLPYDLDGFEDALDEYYERRGWNDDGTVPESEFADEARVS
ncbi:aldehyde ferredoxin oxidoreductase family protein [Natrarchaeobius oligotrophus]|uniref:Aldehyde ferredoxin oxidoreductase n=1 Tax=Natrarchaeobius chitinivorans TaxID=1679083 RepID=A0A3N6MH22_NATCH|nr:aldehyde ferredoxin oxidoreductase C-terminal domain-containing protein [Natrarchaeobius chitinivorans]RQH02368.1 aldehyde ferredoxin oxidoreductase [Natrarchaeobius chitinivorans]